MIKIGNNNLSTIKLGSTQVNKVYVGSNVVWENITYGGLCFTAQEPNVNVRIIKSSEEMELQCNFQYSYDGVTWNDYVIGDNISLTNVGDKVFLASDDNGNQTLHDDYEGVNYIITTSGKVKCSGKVISLLSKTLTNYYLDIFCFDSLFANTKITSIPELPVSGMSGSTFFLMFAGCSDLKDIKQVMVDAQFNTSDYRSMFYSSGLTKAPVVKFAVDRQITFEKYDYYFDHMFTDCPFTDPVIFDMTVLTTIPVLVNTDAFECGKDYRIKVPADLYSQWINATNWAVIADKIISA